MISEEFHNKVFELMQAGVILEIRSGDEPRLGYITFDRYATYAEIANALKDIDKLTPACYKFIYRSEKGILTAIEGYEE